MAIALIAPMKASQRQRLELTLQAAANIAPIQFHIRFSRFSPAIFIKRVYAALAVCGLVILFSVLGLDFSPLWAILLSLAFGYSFYHSALSILVWPKAYVPENTFRQVSAAYATGQSQIIIDVCEFPRAMAVKASADLSDIEELASLSLQLQTTLSADGPIEAIVKAVELSLLAVLPIAATLPPLQSESTIDVVR